MLNQAADAERQDDPNVRRWHHDLHPSVQIHNGVHAIGNSPFLHPTHARLSRKGKSQEEKEEFYEWTSRGHRKNRHVSCTPDGRRRDAKNVWHGIANMRRLEYWNISWWVSIAFTLGSVTWVINGFASFLPLCDNSHFGKATSSTGWSAFIGATIFSIGSFLGMWEAWNRSDAADFGWGVRRALKGRVLTSEGISEDEDEQRIVGEDGQEQAYSEEHSDQDAEKPKRQRWIWFSTDGKYWHELGFLAAFAQFCAANIFWISGLTGIPEIQSSIMDNTGLQDGIYWTPQVVGGSGFIISATLLMLETQKRWYHPEPLSLGWHVGFWNFIGAVGFTLCGAFGYVSATSSKAEYQSTLSTFWGGWAFLIGSLVQWYEAVNSVSS